jgi:cobalt/nickel transport system permease protein
MNGLGTREASREPGWLDRRDARLRLVAVLAFALVTVSLSGITPLLAALAVAFVLVWASAPDWRALVRRMAGLEAFLALLFVTLPFSVPGEAWARFGPLTASWEGVLRASVIALKANAVVLALLGLVGTQEPAAMGHALARLKAPDKLVHLLLFTVRYLGVLQEEFLRLRRAMRARAFVARSDRHTWRVTGWLAGMLLVRGFERARRVSAAMKCRGFHGRFYLLDTMAWAPADTLLSLVFGIGLTGLLALDRLA